MTEPAVIADRERRAQLANLRGGGEHRSLYRDRRYFNNLG
jgi:hypothetical protein